MGPRSHRRFSPDPHRIHAGSGSRALGRPFAPHQGHGNAGYEYLEVVIDDTVSYAVVVPVLGETDASA